MWWAILLIKPIDALIGKCRNVVSKLSYSPKSWNRFKALQVELNIAPKRMLVQDISTRWNSTFYMLERIYEQRSVLAIFVDDAETTINIDLPTRQEWMLIGEIIQLLRPFEEITKGLSFHQSCISETIPACYAIKVTLNEKLGHLTESTAINIKRKLLSCIKLRFESTRAVANFQNINRRPNLAIATFLDPRFKHRFSSTTLKQCLLKNSKNNTLLHLLLALTLALTIPFLKQRQLKVQMKMNPLRLQKIQQLDRLFVFGMYMKT